MNEFRAARKSTHYFKSQTEELKTLIYNWEPIYTGLGGPGTTPTTTKYNFKERERERERREREREREKNS
jgi:hypothetical protein